MIEFSPGLFRGPQPDVAALQELYCRGVKTILSLEFAETSEGQWQSYLLGIRQIDMPFLPFFPPEESQVKRYLILMNDPNLQPLYVHCRQGVDRTGFIVASYRIRCEAWSKNAAIDEMFEAGMHWRFHWWKYFL